MCIGVPVITLFQRGHVLMALAFVMIVSLSLAIVTGAVALILNGQPSGNGVAWVTDVSAWIFSLAFLAALTCAMIDQHRREGTVKIKRDEVCATRQLQ